MESLTFRVRTHKGANLGCRDSTEGRNAVVFYKIVLLGQIPCASTWRDLLAGQGRFCSFDGQGLEIWSVHTKGQAQFEGRDKS